MKKNERNNVKRTAKKMHDAGYRLPNSREDVGELTCSVKGCKSDGQTAPFKASMYVEDGSDLVPNSVHFDHLSVAMWWLHVDAPLTEDGKLAPVCQADSNLKRKELQRPKVEELISTISDDLLKDARRVLSENPKSWLARKLDKESNAKKVETMAWLHPEARAISPCVPLHDVFLRLRKLEDAKGEEFEARVNARVIERETMGLSCAAPSCAVKQEAEDMKALTLVKVEGRQYFTLQCLLKELMDERWRMVAVELDKLNGELADQFKEVEEVEDTLLLLEEFKRECPDNSEKFDELHEKLDKANKTVEQLYEKLIDPHYEDGRAKPIYLCRNCANGMLRALVPSGRWSFNLGDDRFRQLYEPAMKVIRRLAVIELREEDRVIREKQDTEQLLRNRKQSKAKMAKAFEGIDFSALNG